MSDLMVGRKSDIQIREFQENCPWQKFRNECRRDSGPFVPAHLLSLFQARPSFIICRNEGDLLKHAVQFHPPLDISEPEILSYVRRDAKKEIEKVRAVTAEKGSSESENLPRRLSEMVESDSLGCGRAFIFVTLIGDEKIEISGVLVLEIGREGKAPGAPCIGLPQWLPAVFALLFFPV